MNREVVDLWKNFPMNFKLSRTEVTSERYKFFNQSLSKPSFHSKLKFKFAHFKNTFPLIQKCFTLIEYPSYHHTNINPLAIQLFKNQSLKHQPFIESTDFSHFHWLVPTHNTATTLVPTTTTQTPLETTISPFEVVGNHYDHHTLATTIGNHHQQISLSFHQSSKPHQDHHDHW